MDQIKIGKFISERRRELSLTQMQLAEKLGITDRAVSKWERGLSIPDAAIMLDLCEVLNITVNDLLCGEITNMDNIDERNEKILLDLSKEIEEKNKIIWTSMWVIIIASITALIAGLAIAAFVIPEGVWQLVAILGICLLFLTPCFYALKLEVNVGTYKCKNAVTRSCRHIFRRSIQCILARHAT